MNNQELTAAISQTIALRDGLASTDLLRLELMDHLRALLREQANRAKKAS
jgi:hypothetical protein